MLKFPFKVGGLVTAVVPKTNTPEVQVKPTAPIRVSLALARVNCKVPAPVFSRFNPEKNLFKEPLPNQNIPVPVFLNALLLRQITGPVERSVEEPVLVMAQDSRNSTQFS